MGRSIEMTRPSDNQINAEVARILEILRDSFETCYPLIKRSSNLPQAEGIYALRRLDQILYIGKSANIRMRFQGGHKALSYALIDGYAAQELRIAVAPLVDETFATELNTIEGRLLLMVRPPYNVVYPISEV
jgi:excinuclease UvrABC nuclease subunit